MNDNNLTAKELYEQKKEQKVKKTQNPNSGKLAKRLVLWFVVVAGLAALVFGTIKLANNSAMKDPILLNDSVSAADWVKGNKDSKVILIEYGDFQCPACAAYHPLVDQLLKDFDGKIQFVYRNLPLRQIHRNAQISAQAAGAAGQQGKFWEMYDQLFKNQSSWATKANPKDTFKEYAQTIGLNVEKYERDLDSDVVKDKIDSDLNGADKAGLDSTPTFFLNGTQIKPLSYEDFKQQIQKAIDAQPK